MTRAKKRKEGKGTISDASLEARSAFLDVLMQNIQYADVNTQKKIPAFYSAYLDMLEYEIVF